MTVLTGKWLRAGICRAICACVLLASSALVLAQDEAQGDAPAVDQSPSPPVAELFAERDDLEEYLLSIELPGAGAYLAAQRESLQGLSDTLADVEQAVSGESLDTISFEVLVDLQTELHSEMRRLEAFSRELQSRATARDGELDELAERRQRWDELMASARQREAPASVLDVAERISEDLDRTAAGLRGDRDAALEVLAQVASLQNSAARLDAELRDRRIELGMSSQYTAGAPLWRAEAWQGIQSVAEIKRDLSATLRSVIRHVAEHWLVLLALLLGIGFGSHWLLTLTGQRVRDAMQNDAMSVRAAEVFKRPHSAAVLAALLGVAWLGPPAPQAFDYLLWAVIPFPAAALAVTIFASPIRLSVYTIAIVLAVMALKPFLDPMPLLSRFVLLLQALAMATAIVVDYRRGNYARAFPGVSEKTIRRVAGLVCVLLVAIVVTEIVGFVGLANTLRAVVLGGLGFAMIFTSVTYVIIGLAMAILHIRPVSGLPVVRNQRWTIIRTVRRSVRFLMSGLWLIATLQFAGLFDAIMSQVRSMLDAEVGIGAISFSVSSIAVGFAILAATWLINRFVKFVLAGQSLDGTDVSIGFAYAASKILSYIIVVAGVLFAIAAMGFDITQVTLLAGALGVGIGFGLQNIVNNFFSGLILLFEQPIKINDIAAVDNLMGKVKAMNIRSTVIETFDGAEVIVPNGDFISKTVTNWTKSNRRRRVEIDVGVAYGTESQKVLDILESVAQGHGEVTHDPPPFAIFTGFGDSSLNFRLYVWLEELSQILTTPSRIRQEILDALIEAGIEIPFPQRDIRVTMAGGEMPGRTAGGESGTDASGG
jgi:potassium efflux system protein